MHRMHANRSTVDGTSNALSDTSLTRIADKINTSKIKNQRKKIIKKTASNIKSKPDTNKIIKISSINEIPEDFERIGTGFYRRGHHLWELNNDGEGLLLVRKRGEDHVLGYDPQPVERNPIMDRFGNTIKIGSRVKFPHHGKEAAGTVVLLQPGSLGLDMGGEQLSAPPGMVEIITSLMSKIVDGQVNGKEIEIEEIKDNEEESDEEGYEDNEEELNEFEPDVESSSKKAQIERPPELLEEYMPEEEDIELPRLEEEVHSDIAKRLDQIGEGKELIIYAEDQNRWYMARKIGEGSYELYMAETDLNPIENISTREDLAQFEGNVGRLQFTASKRIAGQSYPDMKAWGQYWHEVGQRVAQAKLPIDPSKPSKTPKLPPKTPEQKKQERRQRRKERREMTKNLPPGMVVPPRKPVKAATEDEQIAELKEINRIFEQTFDEIKYILKDEMLKEDPDRLASEMENIFAEHEDKMEELTEGKEEAIEEELSIETLPHNKTMDVERVAMSMGDLLD